MTYDVYNKACRTMPDVPRRPALQEYAATCAGLRMIAHYAHAFMVDELGHVVHAAETNRIRTAFRDMACTGPNYGTIRDGADSETGRETCHPDGRGWIGEATCAAVRSAGSGEACAAIRAGVRKLHASLTKTGTAPCDGATGAPSVMSRWMCRVWDSVPGAGVLVGACTRSLAACTKGSVDGGSVPDDTSSLARSVLGFTLRTYDTFPTLALELSGMASSVDEVHRSLVVLCSSMVRPLVSRRYPSTITGIRMRYEVLDRTLGLLSADIAAYVRSRWKQHGNQVPEEARAPAFVAYLDGVLARVAPSSDLPGLVAETISAMSDYCGFVQPTIDLANVGDLLWRFVVRLSVDVPRLRSPVTSTPAPFEVDYAEWCTREVRGAVPRFLAGCLEHRMQGTTKSLTLTAARFRRRCAHLRLQLFAHTLHRAAEAAHRSARDHASFARAFWDAVESEEQGTSTRVVRCIQEGYSTSEGLWGECGDDHPCIPSDEAVLSTIAGAIRTTVLNRGDGNPRRVDDTRAVLTWVLDAVVRPSYSATKQR